MRPWAVAGVALLAIACTARVAMWPWGAGASLMRVTTRLPADARAVAHPLVLTLGGPVYCGQAASMARYLEAILLCPDYGQNGERSGTTRRRRTEDWGDPRYLDAVARLPELLRDEGIKISDVVLVGASYAGYAVAELAATHPDLRPRALIVVDSFLDLRARFSALAPGQITRHEMVRVLGGTPAQRPHVYRRRSPSHHLPGLARAIRHGMRFVDVWSVAPSDAREFNGGMCSPRSNAVWLRRLSSLLGRPITGYVTELPHGYALWDWWRQLLALADLAPRSGRLPARSVRFEPDRPIARASYCTPGTNGYFTEVSLRRG